MFDFPNTPTIGQQVTTPNGVFTWDGVKWAPAGTSSAPSAPFNAMAYNNFIINSTMELSQENGSTVITLVNGTPKYIVDQWRCQYGNAAAVMLAAQATSTGLAGMQTQYIMGMTSSTAMGAIAAGDFARIYQDLEGMRFERAQFGTALAQPVTISFWAYTTIAGTFSVSLRNGANNRSYVTNLSSVGQTWQYFTVTVPGDTAGTWAKDNTAGCEVCFTFACGATFQTTAGAWQAGNYLATASITNFFASNSNAVYITGVVMTLGTVAPPQATQGYMYRSADQELALCKRYYESILSGGNLFCGNTVSGTTYYALTNFTVMKCKAPTMSLIAQNQNGFPSAPGATSSVTSYGFLEGRTATASVNGGYFQSQWIADARL